MQEGGEMSKWPLLTGAIICGVLAIILSTFEDPGGWAMLAAFTILFFMYGAILEKEGK